MSRLPTAAAPQPNGYARTVVVPVLNDRHGDKIIEVFAHQNQFQEGAANDRVTCDGIDERLAEPLVRPVRNAAFAHAHVTGDAGMARAQGMQARAGAVILGLGAGAEESVDAQGHRVLHTIEQRSVTLGIALLFALLLRAVRLDLSRVLFVSGVVNRDGSVTGSGSPDVVRRKLLLAARELKQGSLVVLSAEDFDVAAAMDYIAVLATKGIEVRSVSSISQVVELASDLADALETPEREMTVCQKVSTCIAAEWQRVVAFLAALAESAIAAARKALGWLTGRKPQPGTPQLPLVLLPGPNLDLVNLILEPSIPADDAKPRLEEGLHRPDFGQVTWRALGGSRGDVLTAEGSLKDLLDLKIELRPETSQPARAWKAV